MTKIYSIGHSNGTYQQFLEHLQDAGVECLVDIRSFPGSRRVTWTQKEALKLALKSDGISYFWNSGLGGRRRPSKSDPTAQFWRVEGFRGYAEYIQTDPFREALAPLIERAETTPTAFMCAEAVWWRCHRRILSDVMIAHGFIVVDLPQGKEHSKTPEFDLSSWLYR